TIQPFESQQVLDHLTAHQALVDEQLRQHRLELFAPVGRDEVAGEILIDLLSEAGQINVREATCEGLSSAVRSATAPPSECPTRCAFGTSIAFRTPSTDAASVAGSPAPTSLVDPPCPGRSSAMTRWRSDSAGWMNSQLFRSPPKPWIRTTGSPSCSAPVSR